MMSRIELIASSYPMLSITTCTKTWNPIIFILSSFFPTLSLYIPIQCHMISHPNPSLVIEIYSTFHNQSSHDHHHHAS